MSRRVDTGGQTADTTNQQRNQTRGTASRCLQGSVVCYPAVATRFVFSAAVANAPAVKGTKGTELASHDRFIGSERPKLFFALGSCPWPSSGASCQESAVFGQCSTLLTRIAACPPTAVELRMLQSFSENGDTNSNICERSVAYYYLGPSLHFLDDNQVL